MNPFALVEKLINEHGSATIQKERLVLAAEQYAALERKAIEFETENAELKKKVEILECEKKSLEADVKDLNGKIRDYEKKVKDLRRSGPITEAPPWNPFEQK